jgi:hypothetical protein
MAAFVTVATCGPALTFCEGFPSPNGEGACPVH